MKNYVNFKAFRKDLDKAMEGLAKQYGITLKAGNISYDDNTFTVKVMAERTDVDVQKTQFMSNLMFMKWYGFTENDYKAKVVMNGKTYTLIGFKPGNKYDVVAERSDGKQFALVAEQVIKAMGRELK